MESSSVKKEIDLTRSECMGNLPQEDDLYINKGSINSMSISPLHISNLSNLSNLSIVKQEIDDDEQTDLENISSLDSNSFVVSNSFDVTDNQTTELTPIIISATSLSDENILLKNEPDNLQIIDNNGNHQIDDNFEVTIKSEPKDEPMIVEGFVMPLEVDISNPIETKTKKPASKRGRKKKVQEKLQISDAPADSGIDSGTDDVEKLFNPLEEKYETTNLLGLGRIKCLLCKSIVSSSSFRCHLRTHCKYFPYQCGFCAFTATGRSLIEQHIKFKHRTIDFKIFLTPNMEQQKETYLLLLRDNKFPIDSIKPTVQSKKSKSTTKTIQATNTSNTEASNNTHSVVPVVGTTKGISTVSSGNNSMSLGTNQTHVDLSNIDLEQSAGHSINSTPESSNQIASSPDSSEKSNQGSDINKSDNLTENSEQFICTICGQHFGNRGALGIHVKYEIQRLPFSCKSCTFRCRTAKELEKHNTLRKHDQPVTEIMPKPSVPSSITCHFCKGVYSPETIGKHIKNHEEKESYQCSYCSFTCQGKNGLKDHMSKNHPGKPVCMVKLATKSAIRCQICKVNCSTQASLNVHVKTTHWKRECFCCGHCGFKSENRAVVVQHNKDEHPNLTASVKVKYKQKDKVVKTSGDSEEEVSNNENSDEDSNSDDENIAIPPSYYYDKEIENLDEIDTILNEINLEDNSVRHREDENIADKETPILETMTEFPSSSQNAIPCPLCHKKLPLANIMSHLDTHLNQKFFQCIYCNYKADDRAITKSHIKQTHPNKPLFTISINMGTQMLNTAKEQVESELLTDKGGDGNKLNCRLCPKKLGNILDLNKHYKNSHGHVCSFFCTYCFTNLKSRDLIIIHIRNEHKGKEFKYKAKYTLPANLDPDGNPKSRSPVYVYDAVETEEAVSLIKDTPGRKEPAKTSTRPLSTSDITPPDQDDLTSKQKEISGPNFVEPGCCPLCGKEVEKNNVVRHMKIHFHMFKYQCKYCNFQKSEAYEVKRHILHKHKTKPVAIIEMTSNSFGNKEAQMKKYVDWFVNFNHDASNDKSSNTSKSSTFSNAAAALEKLQPPNFIILKPLRGQSSLQALRESDRLQCPACSFECVSQDLFNKHKRQHTFTEILYCCEHCNFKDYSKSRVIAHIKKFHEEEEIYINEVMQIQVMVGENAGDITYQTVYTECPRKVKLNPVIQLVDVAVSLPHLMPKQNSESNHDAEEEDDDMDEVVEVKDDEIYQITEIWNKPKPQDIEVKVEIDKDCEPMDISENGFSVVIKKEEIKDEDPEIVTIKQEFTENEEMQIDDQTTETEDNVEEISLVIKQEVDTF